MDTSKLGSYIFSLERDVRTYQARLAALQGEHAQLERAHAEIQFILEMFNNTYPDTNAVVSKILDKDLWAGNNMDEFEYNFTIAYKKGLGRLATETVEIRDEIYIVMQGKEREIIELQGQIAEEQESICMWKKYLKNHR